ncbi:MAG: Stp1/IreP family PP2C-type Ser/Thr phosphatase [Candidatus Obscuribacter sp.]|nr:Stp1/IreP family PP2C-type Ser/Thr phosphatase [Candidatus Melainabacteria bacterium]MBK9279214.1 Stp1/IreP family PP2C-type Ser/Thr phosphatase [Candidatus Obscuribacter sp.]MDX1990523.1 Stp1/IreP family PP2C-type Ser/Thr phosphatase [Candidatus Obscuribacter sp.]
MLKWRAAARTDAGCQRQRNEDNYYVSPDNRVFAVADGMGGAVGGARASKLAMDAVEKQWQEAAPPSTDKEAIKVWLTKTVNEANSAVWNSAEEDQSVRGMGTTIVVAVQSEDNYMQIAHVGDSRAYLYREGKIKLLTNDHSVVQEMVRAGRLTEEQARINPYKNLITRCLGHEERVEIDHTPLEMKPMDWIVLCSDGLPTVLRDEQIGDVLGAGVEPESVCEELVKQTIDGNAPDNVTVVVVKYLDESSDNGSK